MLQAILCVLSVLFELRPRKGVVQSDGDAAQAGLIHRTQDDVAAGHGEGRAARGVSVEPVGGAHARSLPICGGLAIAGMHVRAALQRDCVPVGHLERRAVAGTPFKGQAILGGHVLQVEQRVPLGDRIGGVIGEHRVLPAVAQADPDILVACELVALARVVAHGEAQAAVLAHAAQKGTARVVYIQV